MGVIGGSKRDLLSKGPKCVIPDEVQDGTIEMNASVVMG